MKKISWLILVIFVCSGINGLLFAQENISIKGCYCPRWSPTNEEIGFVGRFSKIVKIDEEEENLVGYSIAAINQKDFSIRYITPIAWEQNKPSAGSRYSKRSKEYEKERNIGDYNTNALTKKQSLVPILSWSTIFDWSTDGTEIFFYDSPVSGIEDDMYMWAIKSDGTNLRPILKTSRDNLPSYLQCLNNGKIAIIPIRRNSFYNTLDIFNGDGKKQSQTTISVILSSADNEGIGLSKDGKKIAIVYNKNIYIKGTSGSKAAVNLTKAEKIGECSWPSWSLDGKKIVFIFEIKFGGKINFLQHQKSVWTIDADGKNCRPLTAMAWDQNDDPIGMKARRGATNDYCPSWSPDGNKIVFLRNSRTHEPWIMNSDGTDQIQLINRQTVAGEIVKK